MKADILVVDHDVSVRRSLAKLLAAVGYRPTTAASGRAGLEQAAKLRPDLILIDMHMPQMSGIDAARAIKADPTLGHVPIIAMSAKSPPGDFEPLFVSFLLKPMSSAKLFATIGRALRRQGFNATRFRAC